MHQSNVSVGYGTRSRKSGVLCVLALHHHSRMVTNPLEKCGAFDAGICSGPGLRNGLRKRRVRTVPAAWKPGNARRRMATVSSSRSTLYSEYSVVARGTPAR